MRTHLRYHTSHLPTKGKRVRHEMRTLETKQKGLLACISSILGYSLIGGTYLSVALFLLSYVDSPATQELQEVRHEINYQIALAKYSLNESMNEQALRRSQQRAN